MWKMTTIHIFFQEEQKSKWKQKKNNLKLMALSQKNEKKSVIIYTGKKSKKQKMKWNSTMTAKILMIGSWF